MNALFFSMGAALPLANVGFDISPGFYLNLSLVIGALLGVLRLISVGITHRALTAAIMILCFAATAIGSQLSSYVLSIAALSVVLLPAVMPMPQHGQSEALLKGFTYGVAFTLAFMWLEITLQVIGLGAVRNLISSRFNDLEHLYRADNFFVYYYRPYVTFAEPANLGIYLAISVAILDQMSSRFSRLLMRISILSIFFVGSFVGLFLIAGYLFTKFVRHYVGTGSISTRVRPKNVLIVLVVLTAIIAAAPAVSEKVFGEGFIQTIVERFDRLRIALIMGEQVGSEGSRANAIFLLGSYWQDTGIIGFLFGEGYGNYSGWLIQHFGHLGQFSTAARGETDNMAVGVFLSTGLFGFLAYLAFISSMIRSAQAGRRLLLFAPMLILQFSSGFLLLYLNWQLPFILMVATGIHAQRQSSTPIAKKWGCGDSFPRKIC